MSSLDRDTLIEQLYSQISILGIFLCILSVIQEVFSGKRSFPFFGFQTVYFFYQKPANKAAYVEVHLAKV